MRTSRVAAAMCIAVASLLVAASPSAEDTPTREEMSVDALYRVLSSPEFAVASPEYVSAREPVREFRKRKLPHAAAVRAYARIAESRRDGAPSEAMEQWRALTPMLYDTETQAKIVRECAVAGPKLAFDDWHALLVAFNNGACHEELYRAVQNVRLSGEDREMLPYVLSFTDVRKLSHEARRAYLDALCADGGCEDSYFPVAVLTRAALLERGPERDRAMTLLDRTLRQRREEAARTSDQRSREKEREPLAAGHRLLVDHWVDGLRREPRTGEVLAKYLDDPRLKQEPASQSQDGDGSPQGDSGQLPG